MSVIQEIEDLCTSNDTRLRTATVSYDKYLKLFDFNTNKVTHMVKEDTPLICLDWCQTDSNFIAYGSEGGDWILRDLRMIDTPLRRESFGPKNPVRKIAFAPYQDSKVIGIGSDVLYFYNVALFLYSSSAHPINNHHFSSIDNLVILS